MQKCDCFESLHRNSSVLSVSSVVILVRVFTSFVSFSVICLSFSSFCYPSVDCGRVASLPGLGLLFFGKWVVRGWWFFDRINKIEGSP
jgi:hypothetical protein